MTTVSTMDRGPVYYNEYSQFPAQWLRNLVRDGMLPNGVVDERSIEHISGAELTGYMQFHTFCGIGGWPIALQKAGWPEDVPVWSGSCPCQPFSTAGKGRSIADDRHLWPEFFRLIRCCQPPHIFGEQVSGRKVTGQLFAPRAWERLQPEDRRAIEEEDAEAWFKHVQTDLEQEGYIVGHCVFPACGVGAPHSRQRLYWYARYVGNTSSKGLEGRQEQSTREECPSAERAGRKYQRVAYSETHRQRTLNGQSGQGVRQEEPVGGYCVPGSVAHAGSYVSKSEKKTTNNEKSEKYRSTDKSLRRSSPSSWPSPTNCHWRTADWLSCRDGKWRPIEPGSSPLAYGILSRASKIISGIRWMGLGAKTFKEVLRESKAILKAARDSRNGQLAGYGNAIVVDQAVAFIQAVMEEDN